MKTLSTIAVIAFVLTLAFAGFAYSGLYDVSAGSSHSRLVDWFLSTTRHQSIERRAHGIEVPDLADESLALAGINDFNSMCVDCHGAPGVSRAPVGQGLNPPAPDLAEEAVEMTPAELFWVTKNGIMMTGMPAWGATHSDEAIWPVVAFMTKLPNLNADGYRQMLTAAAGHGHHAGPAAEGEQVHDETEAATASDIHVHDDGSAHDHGAAAETPAEHDDNTHEHNDD